VFSELRAGVPSSAIAIKRRYVIEGISIIMLVWSHFGPYQTKVQKYSMKNKWTLLNSPPIMEVITRDLFLLLLALTERQEMFSKKHQNLMKGIGRTLGRFQS